MHCLMSHGGWGASCYMIRNFQAITLPVGVINVGRIFLRRAAPMSSLILTPDILNRILPADYVARGKKYAEQDCVSDLEYFKVSYKHQEYFPLSSDFTFRLQADIAYGDGYGDTDELPFFENYYGGGTGSVRGFKNNTLGPRDHLTTKIPRVKARPNANPPIKGRPAKFVNTLNRPFGGSTKMIGSAELFFPVPFLTETKSVRLGAFFDAGRIQNDFGFDRLKYAAGVSGEWLSPFGALSVSAAMPLNADKNDSEQPDQTEFFQFNFGQNF